MYNPNRDEIIQKRLGLINFSTYLNDELGLCIAESPWLESTDLPLYLAKAADYVLCSCSGVDFLAAHINQDASLPDLKRIAKQVSTRAGMPLVLVGQIDPRQRRALVSQGVPFVVPGKQAYLPMLGFAARSQQESAPLSQVLAPGTQAILVALMARPDVRSLDQLQKLTQMPSSSISRALEDLSRRGFVTKTKQGRELTITCALDKSTYFADAGSCMRSPVTKLIYAKKDSQTGKLPLAGESALAFQSMLAPPSIEQRAIAKKAYKEYDFEEVSQGELHNEQTVQIQLWLYEPLIAGGDVPDDVSLALSLIGQDDERIIRQLQSLCNKEL